MADKRLSDDVQESPNKRVRAGRTDSESPSSIETGQTPWSSPALLSSQSTVSSTARSQTPAPDLDKTSLDEAVSDYSDSELDDWILKRASGLVAARGASPDTEASPPPESTARSRTPAPDLDRTSLDEAVSDYSDSELDDWIFSRASGLVAARGASPDAEASPPPESTTRSRTPAPDLDKTSLDEAVSDYSDSELDDWIFTRASGLVAARSASPDIEASLPPESTARSRTPDPDFDKASLDEAVSDYSDSDPDDWFLELEEGNPGLVPARKLPFETIVPLPRALVRQRNGDFLSKIEHDKNLLDPQCNEERDTSKQVLLILNRSGRGYVQPSTLLWSLGEALKKLRKDKVDTAVIEQRLNQGSNDIQRTLQGAGIALPPCVKEIEEMRREFVDPWKYYSEWDDYRSVEDMFKDPTKEAIKAYIHHGIESATMIRCPKNPNRFVEADKLRGEQPDTLVMARDIFVQNGRRTGNFSDVLYRINAPPEYKTPLLSVQSSLLWDMKRATAEAMSHPDFPFPSDMPDSERKVLAKKSWLGELEISSDLFGRVGLRLNDRAPSREASREPSQSESSEDELPFVSQQAGIETISVNRNAVRVSMRRRDDEPGVSPRWALLNSHKGRDSSRGS